MSENMKIWDAVKQPPASALKEIKGGRLAGMTDIKPQWRYQAMTEQFGPCGIGWKFTIERLWTEAGSEDQIVAFANVNLHVKDNGVGKLVGGLWSDPIPGNGGSMLVAKESKGPHTSDEAYKMAITDALSTAMKLLGVAADVYMGNWDGSKFKEDVKPRVNANQKREWAEQTRAALAKGDGAEAKKLWDEWDNDEKIELWSALASQERTAFKLLVGEA
jgi:hypothetical protein